MVSSKYEEKYNLKNKHFMYSGDSTCGFFSFCVVIISVCWDSVKKRLKNHSIYTNIQKTLKIKTPLWFFALAWHCKELKCFT